MNERLLNALQAKNEQNPPVWLMRQAGRFLPEYQAYRRNYSLGELFHHPQIAAEITCLPPKILGVDAAILFSDITVIAETLGLTIHFPEGKGPCLSCNLSNARQVEELPCLDVKEHLFYVAETVKLAKPQLTVPLIGFCGAPFTVATYLIDGSHKGNALKTKRWLKEDPQSFHLLLDKLTRVSLSYLEMQIDTGVDVLQIFDSWADLLSDEELEEFCFPYLKKLISSLKHRAIPLIIFARGISRRVEAYSSLRPTALSLDSPASLAEVRKAVPLPFVLQGNLDPLLLLSSKETVIAETKKLLVSMKKDPGFIVNLGHGVLPNTPVENVLAMIEVVKTFSPFR